MRRTQLCCGHSTDRDGLYSQAGKTDKVNKAPIGQGLVDHLKDKEANDNPGFVGILKDYSNKFLA